MLESSFIGTLINDHSILHIITFVGYDRYNCISSMRVLSEIVVGVLLRLD